MSQPVKGAESRSRLRWHSQIPVGVSFRHRYNLVFKNFTT